MEGLCDLPRVTQIVTEELGGWNLAVELWGSDSYHAAVLLLLFIFKYHNWISRPETIAVGNELHCVPSKCILPLMLTEFRGNGQRWMYFKGQMSQMCGEFVSKIWECCSTREIYCLAHWRVLFHYAGNSVLQV